jgi:hypothetical protein
LCVAGLRGLRLTLGTALRARGLRLCGAAAEEQSRG